MKITVVIPTYNERQNIGPLIDKILGLGIKNLSIIVVDDNSPDGTGKLVDKIAEKKKGIMVIHRPRKLGLGSAYKAGFQKALKQSSQILVTMDADFSHDPNELPKLLKEINGHDIVVGSRYVKGGKIIGFNSWRSILSAMAQKTCRILLNLNTHDSTSGFRVYKTKAIQGIDFFSIKAEGYSFLIEAIFRCQKKGFLIKEVPIVYQMRREGSSKISQNEIVKALVTVTRLKVF